MVVASWDLILMQPSVPLLKRMVLLLNLSSGIDPLHGV